MSVPSCDVSGMIKKEVVTACGSQGKPPWRGSRFAQSLRFELGAKHLSSQGHSLEASQWITGSS